MKRISTNRFAIVKKGGQYVKPFIDDVPYLLFKRKIDAEDGKARLLMNQNNTYKIVKVKVTIEPYE